MIASIKLLAVLFIFSGCLEAGTIQKHANAARFRARRSPARNAKRLRPVKLSRILGKGHLKPLSQILAVLPHQAFKQRTVGSKARRLMANKRPKITQKRISLLRRTHMPMGFWSGAKTRIRKSFILARQPRSPKRKQSARLVLGNADTPILTGTASRPEQSLDQQNADVTFTITLPKRRGTGKQAHSAVHKEQDPLILPPPPVSAIYEVGDFNNVHISNLLLATNQIEEAVKLLFQPLGPAADGLLTKGLKSIDRESLKPLTRSQIEQFASLSSKGLLLIKAQIARIEAWLDSIHLNFHNILNFFELRAEFEAMKMHVGFDPEPLEAVEERLMAEAETTAEHFRVLKFHCQSLGKELAKLALLTRVQRLTKSTSVNGQTDDLVFKNLNNGQLRQLAGIRANLKADLRQFTERILKIKHQKLVFDKVFGDARNDVQAARPTNSNWIFPITVVLVMISTALLI